MKYTVKWLEKKSEDWIVTTLVNEAGMEYKDVSINRSNKKGEIFPEFDGIINGGTVQGEYWNTPDNTKRYLYPPRAEKSSGRGNFTPNRGATRSTEIKEAQERKEDSIKESASMRDAVQLAIAEFNSYQKSEDVAGSDLEFLIKKWRKFLLDNWSLPF